MNALANLIASQLPGVGQTARLLRLHTPLGANVLLPERVTGVEAISQDAGYRFEITALATDALLDLNALIGQPVLLELLTADSRTELRPWHGHVTAFSLLGSNQGVARYRLVIEPWLAFLSYRTDSFIFQNQSVVDIVESVFADYANQGKLLPAWRWDLSDPGVYPQRSLTTQYNETDLAFIQRLLAADGLYYWFEHTGDTQSDSLGAHTLVIADHNGAFTPEQALPIRFHRADATEKDDSIQTWRIRSQRNSPSISRSSWDYRSVNPRTVSAGGGAVPVELTDNDTPGQYSYPTRDYGQRLADIHHQAWAARETLVNGTGVHRHLAPGLRFALTGHPTQRQDSLCLAVQHQIKNNLSADVTGELEKAMGNIEHASPQWQTTQHLGDKPPGEQDDFYSNEFTAMPAQTPYRPAIVGGHGLRLHPKPTVQATQTALVVGAAGTPVYTDRDHRIKVQFHWQRGAKAHNQQAHPTFEDNAPATDTTGTWVRVATPVAGGNWGSHYIPRVGQEVLVTFINGDIDRPIVTGAVYNGQGQTDAQHNQITGSVGSATANAPAWFAGEQGGHAHPAILSGFKTQALATSQQGTGGYNQLVFDDTPTQLRTELSTTQYATSLALGHLKHQNDNQRINDRGHGAELTTDAFGSVRAGQGLLLTTEPGDQQLSAQGAQNGLSQAHSLIQSLADTAEAQQATNPDDPKAKDLPTALALADTQESIGTTNAGAASNTNTGESPIKATQGGGGEVPAWGRPDLMLSAPAGIAALTPADNILNTGTHLSLSAEDINLLTQKEHSAAVALGLRLFTQGKAANPNKPNQETGIAMHAAKGPVTAQAQSGKATLAADKSVTFASTEADVDISANKHILLNAAGAGLMIKGGDITLTAPGAVTFHAGQHVLTGPGSGTPEKVTFAKSKLKPCPKKAGAGAAGGASSLG